MSLDKSSTNSRQISVIARVPSQKRLEYHSQAGQEPKEANPWDEVPRCCEENWRQVDASAESASMGEEFNPADEAADFHWHDDKVARLNYTALGRRLAQAGDLFRNPQDGSGLIRLLPGGSHVKIVKGSDLWPVIADRMRVRVVKAGKLKGNRINAGDLNAVLKCEWFLSQFTPVDRVTAVPLYLPDFTLTKPGYNDGGVGSRLFYVGEKAVIADGMAVINSFLDVMAFATNADRTNAVAAALTVTLHNFWPGGKPIILATATKSHAGKDTVILFASGVHKSVSISYQPTDWAVERSFVGAVKTCHDAAVIVVENARTERNKFIASAYLERFATDPVPLLFSTGTGQPVRVRNDFVLAISTNFGTVSEDILNRALPIHLNPTGNIADRDPLIGNPKLEFLPANEEKIAAELRGMIERWTAAGRPLDTGVHHPFGPWAKTVGGILKVNGFTDFLTNYGARKTADDPLRRALGILGSTHPDEWLTPSEWVPRIVELGLVKLIIPVADQGSEAGRRRGVGVVFSNHQEETLQADTEDELQVTLILEKLRGRNGGEGRIRYQFKLIKAEQIGS